MTLDPICEQCVAALANKNPQIKAETASFLSRSFSLLTMATLPKKLLKMFVASLLKVRLYTYPTMSCVFVNGGDGVFVNGGDGIHRKRKKKKNRKKSQKAGSSPRTQCDIQPAVIKV